MDNACSKVPNYLKELLKKSKQHLDAEQTIELARLLFEFQDIFSKNDLDLGHFTKIKHRIDTVTHHRSRKECEELLWVLKKRKKNILRNC